VVIVLELCSDHLKIIQNQAQSTYPEECCGLLVGNRSRESKTVVQVHPTENVWNAQAMDEFTQIDPGVKSRTSKRGNYAIAPEDILKVQRLARDRQMGIIGVYHSHPDSPAVPSEFDRAIAWQEYSYIIISVTQGKAGDIRSWCLNDAHEFESEAILVR
jgi:proteasome lid subunit RPN8/RPN11